jgi:hypothetical protein
MCWRWINVDDGSVVCAYKTIPQEETRDIPELIRWESFLRVKRISKNAAYLRRRAVWVCRAALHFTFSALTHILLCTLLCTATQHIQFMCKSRQRLLHDHVPASLANYGCCAIPARLTAIHYKNDVPLLPWSLLNFQYFEPSRKSQRFAGWTGLRNSEPPKFGANWTLKTNYY